LVDIEKEDPLKVIERGGWNPLGGIKKKKKKNT